MSEIPSAMQREALEWAVEQDNYIIEAAHRWRAGDISEADLFAICGEFVYLPHLLSDDLEYPTALDVYGSADVFIRLYDDGVLPAAVYDALLRHIAPLVMRAHY